MLDGTTVPMDMSLSKSRIMKDSETWHAAIHGSQRDTHDLATEQQQLDIGWISNKVLLNSIGNDIQHPMINYNGREVKKECLYVYN